VLEVVTPLLREHGSSEIHLDSLTLEQGYLQTSPEFAMKCLVADSRQSIYQICPAFRYGESGHRHRIEFQMLEWYRVDYSLRDLMDDLESLLARIRSGSVSDEALLPQPLRKVSYATLFKTRFGACPHASNDDELMELCAGFPVTHLGEDVRRADMLDALFSLGIEPGLVEGTLVFDYPACQAALAEYRIDDQGNQVADRFEFFLDGMEIANAYQELIDPEELTRRFSENNAIRRTVGKPEVADDPALIEATARMPRCAGIALGIDRLLMALYGEPDISQV